MISKEKLDRINELARKKRTVGLTDQEARERKALHEEYLEGVRQSLRAQLDSIEFVDEMEGGSDGGGPEDEEDEELRITLSGNPANPVGEDGRRMLERMNDEHSEMFNWAFDFLGDFKPKSILDVGCGGGAAIKELHKRYPEAHIDGIDISDVSVEKAIEMNKEAVDKGKVTISKGSVEDLPYKNGSFDLVVSVSSYFFWDDIKKGLEQIKRVMSDDAVGLLISAVYKTEGKSDVNEVVRDKFMKNFLSKSEFKTLFKEVGFGELTIHNKDTESWICLEFRK